MRVLQLEGREEDGGVEPVHVAKLVEVKLPVAFVPEMPQRELHVRRALVVVQRVDKESQLFLRHEALLLAWSRVHTRDWRVCEDARVIRQFTSSSHRALSL